MKTKLIGFVILAFVCFSVAIMAGIGKNIKGGKTITLGIDYDSAGDTNASGWSYVLEDVGLTNNMKDYDAAVGRVLISDGIPAARGTGLIDSAYIVLCTSLQGLERRMDSINIGALPGSLYFAISCDTCFYHDLYLELMIADSTTDTAFDRDYKIKWDIIVKGS